MNIDCTNQTFNHINFNKLAICTKNKRNIIRLYLNDDNNYSKFMLINDCIPLRGKDGNIPYYALQGDDISYLYNYGKFYHHQEK